MSDNPQAYPCLDSSCGELSMRDPGMTLRDYFAGQALAIIEANARLIAAAPELLDIAERMMEVLEFAYMGAPEQPKEIAQYRAIRAKIWGKP